MPNDNQGQWKTVDGGRNQKKQQASKKTTPPTVSSKKTDVPRKTDTKTQQHVDPVAPSKSQICEKNINKKTNTLSKVNASEAAASPTHLEDSNRCRSSPAPEAISETNSTVAAPLATNTMDVTARSKMLKAKIAALNSSNQAKQTYYYNPLPPLGLHDALTSGLAVGGAKGSDGKNGAAGPGRKLPLQEYIAPANWPDTKRAQAMAVKATTKLVALLEDETSQIPQDPGAPSLLPKGMLDSSANTKNTTVDEYSHHPDPARGMLNTANACFMNATLQALVHIPAFASYLAALGGHSEFLAGANPDSQERANTKDSLMCRLGHWVTQYYSSTIHSTNAASAKRLAPSSTKAPAMQGLIRSDVNVAKGGNDQRAALDVSGSTQEDASEFLQLLFETLRREELQRWGEILRPTLSSGSDQSSATTAAAKQKQQQSSKFESSANSSTTSGGKWITVGVRKGEERMVVVSSPLNPTSSSASAAAAASSSLTLLSSRIFNGTLRSHLKGSGAKGVTSVTIQPFFLLPVDIHHKGRQPLEEAIKNTFMAEVVVNEDRNGGTGSAEMRKQELIGTLPNVLVIQLKRWAVTSEGDVVKIDNIVSFGPSLVMPAEVCAEKANGAERSYTLKAVVCHRGMQAVSGHYVTYLNNCPPSVVDEHITAAPPSTTNANQTSVQNAKQGASHQQQAGTSAAVSGGGNASKAQRHPMTLCDDSRISVVPLSKAVEDTPYFLFWVRNAM